MLAIDTETTGLDFWHGCRPFRVSTCDGDGVQRSWEWPVDPLTREVAVDRGDLDELRELVDAADAVVGHNLKFDVHALASVGFLDFPWGKARDTLLAGHLLSSGTPHNLTDMAVQFLGVDVHPLEVKLKKAVDEARRLTRKKEFVEKNGRWRIGKDGDPMLPSGGGSGSDYWLPKAAAGRWTIDGSWWTVLEEYSDSDAAVTMMLWKAEEAEILDRKLDKIYRSRLELLPVVWEMEHRGVTLKRENVEPLMAKYAAESERLGEECVRIAAARGYDLEMPAGGVNGSLRRFCFDVLDLERRYDPKSRSGEPTLNKDAVAHYMATLPEGDARDFVEAVVRRRKMTTSVGYMESYLRYAVDRGDGVLVVHPNLNVTGTATLRHSSDSPNEQSVGKAADEDGSSLRSCFGPARGREWWPMDYENIELRIPAYEAGEKELIDLFERSGEPPYYGSEHILNFHTVYPDVWDQVVAEVGLERAARHVKETMKSTWYKRCKNGDFAVGYQAGDATADRAFGRPGSRARLKARFARKEELVQKYVAQAYRTGQVETLPDRSVDPDRGYPVQCRRGEGGRVVPTVPFNYHVQSTAMQCTNRAMVRCRRQLDEWNEGQPESRKWYIAVETHDEIVFDAPAGGRRNLPKVRRLRALMEQSGDDVGIPLKVSVSWCPDDWGTEEEPR